MPKYHIVQVNIARMLAPIDDPIMEAFVAQLAPINALADRSPGFVWRLQTEEGDTTSLKVYDDDLIIVNMSVWKNVESLREYAYRSSHTGVMKYRTKWFEKFDGPYYALWWVPVGISQPWKKVWKDWSACENMEIRDMRFHSRMFSLRRKSEEQLSIQESKR